MDDLLASIRDDIIDDCENSYTTVLCVRIDESNASAIESSDYRTFPGGGRSKKKQFYSAMTEPWSKLAVAFSIHKGINCINFLSWNIKQNRGRTSTCARRS
jgi:hypothetical protein